MAIALPPTPIAANASHEESDEHAEEHAPLIAETEQASDVGRAPPKADLEHRYGDNASLPIAFGAAVLILLLTWAIVFASNPFALGWFFYHPVLQTASLLAFTYGIVTLQPTAHADTKAAGLSRHQRAMLLLGFPAITFGVFAMWLNKTVHGAAHATTWHGVFGYMTISWMVIHVLIGGGSVWFDGRLLGGSSRAKRAWKYHRLSGYLLFPMLLFTIHLAGSWSDWVTMSSLYAIRVVAYDIAPLVLFAAILSRVRLSKMKIL